MAAPGFPCLTNRTKVPYLGLTERLHNEAVLKFSGAFYKTNNPIKAKHMKKLSILAGIAGVGAVLALMAACQTTGTSQSVVAQKEALLTQSGFKVITVTTPKQQQAI